MKCYPCPEVIPASVSALLARYAGLVHADRGTWPAEDDVVDVDACIYVGDCSPTANSVARHPCDNGWRMYSPELGQYLSPDPRHRTSVSQSHGPQAYAYAKGNPLRFTDPKGLFVMDYD